MIPPVPQPLSPAPALNCRARRRATTLGVGLAVDPLAGPWGAAALGVLLVAPAVVLTVRGPIPRWRRVARWAAIAVVVTTMATTSPWVALVLGVVVAAAVVELPHLVRVELVGEHRDLPTLRLPRPALPRPWRHRVDGP